MSVTLEQMFALAESTVKVGLAGPDRQEIEADWYERKPLATELTWQLGTGEPYTGEWLVAWLVVFDGFGIADPRWVPLSEPTRLAHPLQSFTVALDDDGPGGGR